MNADPGFVFHASIGDVVSVPKGLFIHVGVVVPGGILQNRPGSRESVIPWEEFAAGRQIQLQRLGLDPSIVIARARAILASPRAYHAVFQNCEHTVNRVLKGVEESPQLVVTGLIALGLLVAAIVSE
jgi:hypothetical protein